MIILLFFVFGILGYLLEGIFNRLTIKINLEALLGKPKKSFFCFSSPYMIPVFGVGAVLINLIYKIPFLQKLSTAPILMLVGGIVMTLVELSFGILLNKKLKLNIWDYSNSKIKLFGKEIPLNYMGQIDVLHGFLWCLLTIPICLTDTFIRFLA